MQELSKQADTRLQLWSERWRVDQNYYQPLSSAGATQLADALCVAVANAGHPQLVAEVAIRNEFFLKQISQLALTHQLKRQQSMQAYRARLHAAEQELIQCTQEVLAISRHREPVELSLAANTDGVGLGAKLPQRTPVEVAAEDIGAHILIRRQADLQEIVRAQVTQIAMACMHEYGCSYASACLATVHCIGFIVRQQALGNHRQRTGSDLNLSP